MKDTMGRMAVVLVLVTILAGCGDTFSEPLGGTTVPPTASPGGAQLPSRALEPILATSTAAPTAITEQSEAAGSPALVPTPTGSKVTLLFFTAPG